MSNELIINENLITNRIYSIRGVQVMLDSDLAEIYQVETRILNQAVKRNLERFPELYRFQLTQDELNEITLKHNNRSKSQIVILNNKRGQNIKYLPYVFTEQGVAMLSAVLRSSIAISVSIQIINAFVEMRTIIANNHGLIQRIEGIERKQFETEQNFEKVFKALESRETIPTQGVFFDGQVFDAYELASRIIKSATKNIVLIDNYIDEITLTHLAKKEKGINVLLLTKNVNKKVALDVQKANEQYGNFTLKSFTQSHDRFVIIDNNEVYHLGASLKDLGKKWFAFSKLDKSSVENILNSINKLK